MTIKNVTSVPESVKEMFTQNSDALRELLRNALEEVLEQQMDVVAGRAATSGPRAGASTARGTIPGACGRAWG
jgi:hypothetical protein